MKAVLSADEELELRALLKRVYGREDVADPGDLERLAILETTRQRLSEEPTSSSETDGDVADGSVPSGSTIENTEATELSDSEEVVRRPRLWLLFGSLGLVLGALIGAGVTSLVVGADDHPEPGALNYPEPGFGTWDDDSMMYVGSFHDESFWLANRFDGVETCLIASDVSGEATPMFTCEETDRLTETGLAVEYTNAVGTRGETYTRQFVVSFEDGTPSFEMNIRPASAPPGPASD